MEGGQEEGRGRSGWEGGVRARVSHVGMDERGQSIDVSTVIYWLAGMLRVAIDVCPPSQTDSLRMERRSATSSPALFAARPGSIELSMSLGKECLSYTCSDALPARSQSAPRRSGGLSRSRSFERAVGPTLQ